jgi:threonine synthase
VPRLIGVQADGSNFMYQAWVNDEDVFTKQPIDAQTVADSISAGLPRDRLKAMAAVKETNGAFVSVSDEEILAAIPAMARLSGVFGEPAGAAAYAGLVKAGQDGVIASDERVVVLNTGSGLKDVAGAMSAVKLVGTAAHYVDPELDDLKQVMQTL